MYNATCIYLAFIFKDDETQPKPIAKDLESCKNYKTNSELLSILEANNLLDLGEKFSEAGVTADVLWDLEEDQIREEVKLNKIQHLRFRKAKQKIQVTNTDKEDKNTKRQQSAADTYGKISLANVSKKNIPINHNSLKYDFGSDFKIAYPSFKNI